MIVSCAACGISIGTRYIETMPCQVGEYSICGWCYGKMRKRGKIEIGRTGNVIVYLLPSGEIIKQKEKINESLTSRRNKEIKRLSRAGKTDKELATMFGLGIRQVYRILNE